MMYSLRSKLSLTYVLITLLCVALLSVLINVFLERQFKDYIINNMERKNNEIVNSISQQFGGNGKWADNVIENIGVNALEEGLIVKVIDSSGRVIWDATVHNNGLCQQMIVHMSQNMSSHFPNWKGEYIEKKYPLESNFKEIGSVEIGYYGPFYFNDNDLAFLNALNKVLAIVGVVSLLFALLLGAFMAKRISNPISRVISTAEMISKGYFNDRITENSNTKEICQLTSTINNLAETLEKQEVLRKRLTGDVAHELRTPLATLQSHLEAMIDGIWKPDTDRLKSCHEEVMRINRMVGDLEKLARYESENLVLNKERFDITGLIEKIVQNSEADFLKKELNLKFYGEEEIIFADKDKITQVLVNLISNAFKYTPAGGAVEINVKGSDDMTEISVKDNGIGIHQDDLPNIFERFYRADKSRNRLTGGSGIGLTIAKAIIEAHKGRIEVRSALNEGTEFIVYLPKQEV